jgi:hypothetical protein
MPPATPRRQNELLRRRPPNLPAPPGAEPPTGSTIDARLNPPSAAAQDRPAPLSQTPPPSVPCWDCPIAAAWIPERHGPVSPSRPLVLRSQSLSAAGVPYWPPARVPPTSCTAARSSLAGGLGGRRSETIAGRVTCFFPFPPVLTSHNDAVYFFSASL